MKREDLSCPPPGPPFSKTRGVFAHVKKRPEKIIGVLDTYHSQAGHAVAQACALLGKQCINFYPVRKADQGKALQAQQVAAEKLGAALSAIPAGRSAILYHQARKILRDYALDRPHYLMPNALKLPEMVEETAAEVARTVLSRSIPQSMPVLIAASSGTIASGVIRGFWDAGYRDSPFIIHLGYSRSREAVERYMAQTSGLGDDFGRVNLRIVDEGYSYGDKPRNDFAPPPWPCNPYYDLKAFRWWAHQGRALYKEAILWNIG